jgi:hypothetical protein
LMEGTHFHKLPREETLIRHVQKQKAYTPTFGPVPLVENTHTPIPATEPTQTPPPEGIHSNIWPCSFGRDYTHADPSYRTNSNTTTDATAEYIIYTHQVNHAEGGLNWFSTRSATLYRWVYPSPDWDIVPCRKWKNTNRSRNLDCQHRRVNQFILII